MLFPEEHQPGVDLILPDFTPDPGPPRRHRSASCSRTATKTTSAPCRTCSSCAQDIPLIGSTLTLALIEAKLKEHRITPYTLTVQEGQHEKLGPFDLEFVAVNHSIPDALAVAIRTPAGLVLHTGDFKMDQLPLDDRITDLRAFARLGEEGVDLFLPDSTNADVPGLHRRSSATSARCSRASSPRRRAASSSRASPATCTACSRCWMPRTPTAAASPCVGRSMVRNMGIAADLGYLKVPEGVLVDFKKAARPARRQDRLHVAPARRASRWPCSARMANLEHQIEVGEGDTVILASSLIPGNENAVYRVINGLTKLGANVVHKGNAKVHVSGHAAAGELLYCYNILQAARTCCRCTASTATWSRTPQLAIETGVPEENTIIGEDGTVIDLQGRRRDASSASSTSATSTSTARPSARSRMPTSRTAASSPRRASSRSSSRSTPQTGRVIVGPEIQARGFAEDEAVFDDVQAADRRGARGGRRRTARATRTRFSRSIRRTVGRWVNTQHRRRPMIIPVVIEA